MRNPFDELENTMTVLRSENGCPWDKEQTLQTLKPYLVEETYEVLDAIDACDPEEHLEELGDLLLQIVFQSQLRKEEGHFTFGDVARIIDQKLKRRHPHIFVQKMDITSKEVESNWEEIKQTERAKKSDTSRFAGIPKHLPALQQAQKLSQKASVLGLDWSSSVSVSEKLMEELDELKDALQHEDHQQIEEEFGDVVFTMVNLARHLQLDAESALRKANRKFEQRARFVEKKSKNGELTAAEVDMLWQQAKLHE